MELVIVISNFVYAVLGVCLAFAFMAAGYKLFDKMTPFDTGTQLAEQNIAVGIVIGSIFISIGIAVGLVIGLGLN